MNRNSKRYIDTFIVTEIDLSFNLENEEVLCKGNEKITLEANIFDVDYKWQDGSTLHYFDVIRPGVYWLEVSAYGCYAADTLIIEELKAPYLGDDVYFCVGELINLNFHVSDIPEGTMIKWSTGSTDSFISVQDSGMYWVSLSHPPCIVSDSVMIIVEMCECFSGVPNAFSPNGDGVNDYFLPIIESNCPNVSNFKMNIYNRFGERVFSSYSHVVGWDGTYNNGKADVGIYFYEIYFTAGKKQKEFYKKGDLALIH